MTLDRSTYESERRKVLRSFVCDGKPVEEAESELNRLDALTVDDRPSQLALVKALRELGATHVKVGDVECRFDVVVATPLPRSADDSAFESTPEQKIMSRLRDLERDLNLST